MSDAPKNEYARLRHQCYELLRAHNGPCGCVVSMSPALCEALLNCYREAREYHANSWPEETDEAQGKSMALVQFLHECDAHLGIPEHLRHG